MTRHFVIIALCFIAGGCSHYGGGTSGTGLNFREGVNTGVSSSSAHILSSVTVPMRIVGKVVDTNGRAVKGVELLVESVSDSQTARVSADGDFELSLSAPMVGVITFSLPEREGDHFAEFPIPSPYSGNVKVQLKVNKDGTLEVRGPKN